MEVLHGPGQAAHIKPVFVTHTMTSQTVAPAPPCENLSTLLFFYFFPAFSRSCAADVFPASPSSSNPAGPPGFPKLPPAFLSGAETPGVI